MEDIHYGEATPDSREQLGDTMTESQLEYVHLDDPDHAIQALGPAGAEQVAKLNELKIWDEQTDERAAPMDVDPLAELEECEHAGTESLMAAETPTTGMREHIVGALTNPDRPAVMNTHFHDMAIETDVEMGDVDDNDVEAELKLWQAQGLPENKAEHIWRRYETLTHDLAYALCEQLRLILEPTLATRLKGDYRSGKRLNMKKIIPYIASDYTKDKIWLRRTRPSQREYQVLIALDDSRSMSESHSVHLAYQTLALVSKALGRLEVGELAIVKFGETTEILRGFDEGPFTDQAGIRVINAFQFNQAATNVHSLLDSTSPILEAARERRSISSQSSADLWQLEIIISDGICQDHDRLRTVLRKAEEQRIMIVFIIIDSLSSAVQTTLTVPTGLQNSILSMKQATYKNIDGRMELQMQRYLDSFPFEYYVVLRNVEALPEVLSGTLKQFFERISEQ
jgi:midasin